MSAIILHRTDAAKNMCRFYRLDVQPDLSRRPREPENGQVSGRRASPQTIGLWPGRTARGSGGRNNRHGIRMGNRSRLHYLRVQAFRWLDDTTAFFQFIAETLVSIRGRVSILRASLGGARHILLWNCLITSRIARRTLRHGSSAS